MTKTESIHHSKPQQVLSYVASALPNPIAWVEVIKNVSNLDVKSTCESMVHSYWAFKSFRNLYIY